jgi:hypothetical protein
VKINFSANTFFKSPVEENTKNDTVENYAEEETNVEFDINKNSIDMFVFKKTEMNETSIVNEPVINQKDPNPQITKREDLLEEGEEKFNKKQAERVINLREMSQKIKNQEGLREIEKTPAYIRRQFQMENTKPSSDSEISNLSVGSNDDNKTGIKQNPFLHDNVD